ncbi:uncharacterized protein LOC110424841 [Herrania umbratica]|uniref:Uncharacterized protein LOC110424841 n=1 Tax=Herrania umbratica TaxID=108875 RepID=A0A6J1B7Q5_9ROSI|nr:uncharacterized protein LOC110424841 [Herrania umbratica]
MVSYFWDCKTLGVVIMLLFIQSSMAESDEHPLLYESSSREEMIQMAGYGEEKLSTVLVTGAVLCEACLHAEPQLRAWPISGALVAVKCQTPCKRISGSAQAVTDEYGDFLIDLPSHLHGIPNLPKICAVKVLRIPKNSMCRPAFVKKHKGLRFSSVGNGIRTYTAGRIRFQHITSKPLKACIGRAKQ